MKVLAIIVALCATAIAKPAIAEPNRAEKRQPASSLDSISVLEVLATALPQSLVDLAITNPGAVSTMINSEFAAGSTPAWFTALPKDVQTYLVPVSIVLQTAGGLVSASPTATLPATASYMTPSNATNRTTTATAYGNGVFSNGPFTNGTYINGTGARATGPVTSSSMPSTILLTTTVMGTRTVSPSNPGATGSSTSLAIFAGSASVPTGVIGAGFVGVLGVLGMIAL